MTEVIHAAASLNRDTGGPAVAVTRLADCLQEQDVSSQVVALEYAEHGPRLACKAARVISIPSTALGRRLRGFSPLYARTLAGLARAGGVVHSHGLWMCHGVYARRAAETAGIPLVVSPRGMLEPWSLARRRRTKDIAWTLFEKANIEAAAMLHATSRAEAKSIRALGIEKPIAVISNGVDLPDLARVPPRGMLEERFPALRGKHWLLFLSRLHPKKGVSELLRAWRTIERTHADWQLVMAGPDLDGYGRTMRRAAVELGVERRVTFTGMLAGDAKSCAMAHAALFVLPTHSENFGIVVAEALAHGVPAVTTRAAPWADLEAHRCGLWIDDDEGALASALSDAIALPDEERRVMGERGRALVDTAYSWHRVAAAMRSAYLWLLGGAQRPACVLAD